MYESPHSPPETGPISLPVLLPAEWQRRLSTGGQAQQSGTPMADAGLIPEDVDEPEFVIRGNKLRCRRCGDKYSTREKYINHYRRSHG